MWMNGRVGDYFTRFKNSFARERPYSDTQIDEKQHILLLTAPKERGLPGRAAQGLYQGHGNSKLLLQESIRKASRMQ